MQSHDAEYRESGEGWARTPKPPAMTTPLSDARLTFRAEILAALSAAGAFCGECGFQPGETGCADCVRVRELYADAVMPIVDRLRAELAKYVGHEPTIAEEMAELSRRLDAAVALLPDSPAEDINASWIPPRHIRAAVTGDLPAAPTV